MRVTCIGNSGQQLPKKYLASGNTVQSVFHVELGHTYPVYGISLWDDGTLNYLLQGKNEDLPSWNPSELFRVSESSLPMEWYFNYYSNRTVPAIWGYKELVLDEEHHDALIERESDAIKIFLKRKKEIDEFM